MRLPFPEEKKLIVSIYDYTGQWVKPYVDAGYPVMLWDKKIEGDILEHLSWLLIQIEETGLEVYGLFFAPPCTDYSVSGAWTWPSKDKPTIGFEPFESTTELSDALVLICFHLVDILKPRGFWVLENPVGRIEKRIPELQPFRSLLFNPCDYGDPYTKKTILWGEFNSNLKQTPVKPVKACAQGSWLQKLGGKSEKTKALRSATPLGFAKAFFEANK